MITLRSYQGGLGNNLWQYVVSRTIAERLGLALITPRISGFPNCKPLIFGKIKLNSPEIITGHFLPESMTQKRYIIRATLERYEHIADNRINIKEWVIPNIKLKREPKANELVLAIRRGWNNWPVDKLCPPAEVYIEYLKSISPNKVWITTDSPNDPYFKVFNNYQGDFEIFIGSPLEQFEFIRKARQVIMAPSTFTFWATYAGNAEKIYWPRIEALDFNKHNYDWFPFDDERAVWFDL